MDAGRRRFLGGAGALALAACAQVPASGRRRSGYADVNGTRLYWEAAGTGRPVVLLHSFTLDTRMWDDQFDVLAQQYRVIRYDARGFGRSAVPVVGQPYSHSDDLLALLAHLDARNPDLVGHAMGGRFVLDFAVAHPGSYRSVAVLDSAIGGWPWSQPFLDTYAPVVLAGRRRDIPGAKRAWLAQPLFAPARENDRVAARLQQMVDDYSGWHFVNADPARNPLPPTLARLDRILAPVLVVIGSRDVTEFQRMSERVAHDAIGTHRVVIGGAGHMVNMEAPAPVNAALAAFLAPGA